MLRKLNYGLLMLMTSPVWADVTAKAADKESTSTVGFEWNTSTLEDIIVPTVMFASIPIIVWIALSIRSRNHAETHKTLQLMIEKGVPVSPEMLYTQQNRRPKTNLQRGMIMTALGAGLMIALSINNTGERNSWAFGIIPLFIGLGYLLVEFIENKRKKA